MITSKRFQPVTKGIHVSVTGESGNENVIVDGGYKCYFKSAPKDIKFDTDFKCELVDTVDRFKELTDKVTGKLVAFDSETNTLNFSRKNPVVGVSFSFNAYNGYYVPIRHFLGRNIEDTALFFRLWSEFLGRNNILGYNLPFDLMMMQSEGIDTKGWRCFDVMVLVFNADTNIKHNSLKWAAQHYLGRNPPTFEQIVGKKATFDMLQPSDALYYAACDTANTFGLYERLYPHLKNECGAVLQIDNRVSNRFPDILSTEVSIDNVYMQSLKTNLETRKISLEKDIFKRVGYMFNIDSNRQLSNALESIGIDTGIRNKTGDMKLDEDSLSLVKDDICFQITERKSIAKQLSSYIDKFCDIDSGRINYQLFRVPTGRLSSGNRDNGYFLSLNYQNLTRPSSAIFECVPDTGKDSVLGYSFRAVNKKTDGFYVEGMNQSLNVRKAITVPNREDWYFVSIDYFAEELLIASQLSGEPVYCKAFLTGEDLHKRVAIEMFGEDNYCSENRKKAKFSSFGLLYGGSPGVLEKTAGLSKSEAESTFKQFWRTMKVLNRWKRDMINDTYKRGGVCYTVYGRPRRLKYYLSSHIPKMRAFGERSVASHMIQGTGGDIMRIVLVNLFDNLFLPYPDKIRFVGCVHDEIDFIVKKDAVSLVDDVMEIMCVKPPGFKIPLKVSASFGYSYGEQWPFIRTSDGWQPSFI